MTSRPSRQVIPWQGPFRKPTPARSGPDRIRAPVRRLLFLKPGVVVVAARLVAPAPRIIFRGLVRQHTGRGCRRCGLLRRVVPVAVLGFAAGLAAAIVLAIAVVPGIAVVLGIAVRSHAAGLLTALICSVLMRTVRLSGRGPPLRGLRFVDGKVHDVVVEESRRGLLPERHDRLFQSEIPADAVGAGRRIGEDLYGP